MYYITVGELIASLQKLPKDAEVSTIAYRTFGSNNRAFVFTTHNDKELCAATLKWRPNKKDMKEV